MAKTIDKLDKSVQQTLDMSGYATTNHGTHVTFTSTVPKVAGTAAVGSATTVSRSDHVHPLQTTVSGNAGTATKLATGRTLTIGSTGKAFDGSANVSWTVAEIGAAASSHSHNVITSRGNVTCESGVTARPAVAGLSMSQAYNNGYPTTYGNILNMRGTGDGQLLIGWSGTDGAHAPVYVRSKRDNTSTANWSGWAQIYTTAHKPTPSDIGAAASSHGTHVTYSTTTPKVAGTASAGSAANVARGDHVHPAQTSVSGNAGSATKLATARTLTVGNTGKTFNGSANVSWSLSEIGAAAASHTHSYLPLSGGEMTGRVRLTTAATTTDASTPTQLAYGLLGSYGNLKVLGNTDTSIGADNEYVHIAAGWGLDPAINKGIVVRGTYAECFGGTIRPQYSKTIDLTASKYNVNTWYPCVHANGMPYIGLHRINLAVQLNSGSKPSWSTHDSGFTCNIDVLATAGGWGTTSANSICLQDYYNWANNRPAGYQQLNNSSKPLFYLRGGGKYTIYTDYDTGAWTVYTASTTLNGETFAPTTTAPGVSINRSTVFTNISGNASSASKLETARTLTIGNTGKTFNGSGNVSWTLSEIGAAAASHGNHVPATQTANARKFLRNDNSWQSLPTASTSATGIVQLNNTVTSTSTTQAATANAVKTAYDKANEAFQSGSNAKTKLVNALTAKGATASTSDSWDTLISKVDVVSKKFATGRMTWDYNGRVLTDRAFTINNIGFTPTSMFVVLDNVYCTRTVAADVIISNHTQTTINEDEEYYVTLQITNMTSTGFTIDFVKNYASAHSLRDGLTWYAFG